MKIHSIIWLSILLSGIVISLSSCSTRHIFNRAEQTYIPSITHKNEVELATYFSVTELTSVQVAYAVTDKLYVHGSWSHHKSEQTFEPYDKNPELDIRSQQNINLGIGSKRTWSNPLGWQVNIGLMENKNSTNAPLSNTRIDFHFVDQFSSPSNFGHLNLRYFTFGLTPYFENRRKRMIFRASLPINYHHLIGKEGHLIHDHQFISDNFHKSQGFFYVDPSITFGANLNSFSIFTNISSAIQFSRLKPIEHPIRFSVGIALSSDIFFKAKNKD